jgi:Domain of unknown function (DUF4388)
MALQGNLRDFSAMEILQLVGSQRKSGCLVMEWGAERFLVWVLDGRIVSTRTLGPLKDDALALFLRKVHRLSDEQFKGLLALNAETKRDLEDLLLKGRYVDEETLGILVERQILDDLSRMVRWENGTYRFDPASRWPHPPLTSLSVESGLMEAARRTDEHRRFVSVFKDPYAILAIKDVPPADEPLSDEERELFSIVDGRRTVAEIVEAAPLVEFEAYESLNRMMESNWLEFAGRRDPGQTAGPTVVARETRSRDGRVRELVVAVAVVAVVGLARFGANHLPTTTVPAGYDVHAEAEVRDIRHAVELFAREHGHLPARLVDLAEDHWIDERHLTVPGYVLRYRVLEGGARYELALQPDR